MPSLSVTVSKEGIFIKRELLINESLKLSNYRFDANIDVEDSALTKTYIAFLKDANLVSHLAIVSLWSKQGN